VPAESGWSGLVTAKNLPEIAYAIGDTSGGLIELPEGEFEFEAVGSAFITLPDNVGLIGRGKGVTILKAVGDLNVGNLVACGSGTELVDLTVDANDAARYAVIFSSATSGALRRVEVKNACWHGILVYTSSNVSITDSYSHDNGIPGSAVTNLRRGAGLKLSDSSDITVARSVFAANSEHGCYASSYEASEGLGARYSFSQCTFTGNGLDTTRNGFGITLRTPQSKIVGCHIHGNEAGGVSLSIEDDATQPNSYNMVVSGNTLYGNGTRLGSASEITVRGSDEVLIVNNNITATNARTAGIELRGPSEGILLTGNTVTGFPYSFQTRDAPSKVRIANNYVNGSGTGNAIRIGTTATDSVTDLQFVDNTVYGHANLAEYKRGAATRVAFRRNTGTVSSSEILTNADASVTKTSCVDGAME
jgi:hypothetical protein